MLQKKNNCKKKVFLSIISCLMKTCRNTNTRINKNSSLLSFSKKGG